MRKLLLLIVSLIQVFALPVLKNYDIWGGGDVIKNAIGASGSGYDGGGTMRNYTRVRRVLNFFPVPVEEECLSTDKRRKGVCMNAYECRIQGGSHHGPCALGFGVCCVFTATCNEEVINNITYFVNPDFPDLSNDMTNCTLIVKKIDPEIAQLRLDFIHFNLGQPNRRTGVCEDDVFFVTGGYFRNVRMCGLNSGQHVYFDVENIEKAIVISMLLSKKIVSRLWEVRIIQVPFTERAPSGCLQYHTGTTGIIQTMNFADNGRHLAEQDYNICMRQEQGMCTIAYEPCDPNSFKIGPNNGASDNTAQNTSMMQTASDPSDTNPVSDDPGQDIGSGDGSMMAESSRAMEFCSDRIIMPCDSEDLIIPSVYGAGFCTLARCGNSFCPMGENPCRVESSVTPFIIGVHFGASARESSPDDNLGMCLRYEQFPCSV